MDTAEQQHKLATINTLTAGELQGWWRYVHGYRAPFPGEIAELTLRAQRLGISLPAAPNGSATASAPSLIDTSQSTQR